MDTSTFLARTLGILAPRSEYFSGFFRKSTNSVTSSFASFIPATSANLTLPCPGSLMTVVRALLMKDCADREGDMEVVHGRQTLTSGFKLAPFPGLPVAEPRG